MVDQNLPHLYPIPPNYPSLYSLNIAKALWIEHPVFTLLRPGKYYLLLNQIVPYDYICLSKLIFLMNSNCPAFHLLVSSFLSRIILPHLFFFSYPIFKHPLKIIFHMVQCIRLSNISSISLSRPLSSSLLSCSYHDFFSFLIHPLNFLCLSTILGSLSWNLLTSFWLMSSFW